MRNRHSSLRTVFRLFRAGLPVSLARLAFPVLLSSALLVPASTVSVRAQDLTGLKFCIDPGHGGHNAANDRHLIPDPGTDFWESESNFQKALRLDTLLQARGAWVILTRYTNDYPSDNDPSLSARWALANANNVHWFHSIHSNATGWAVNTTVNYTLVLVKEDIATRQAVWPQAVTMSNIIGPSIQSKLRNSPRTTWTYLDYTFYGGPNGGFNLGVLNGLAMPGELSEGSFHDNFPETRRLMNNNYLKMEAYALRNAFMQYFGVPADTFGIIAGIQTNVATGMPVNLTRVRLLPGDRVVNGDAYNNGFYAFDNLPSGAYTLRFETPGYTPDSVQVNVGTGATVFVDRSLVSFAYPSVLTTTPVNNDTAFSGASSIEIAFSKPMDTASVRAAFSITPGAPGIFSWATNNTRMTFDPVGLLDFWVDYTVRVDTTARSASGQTLDANGDGTPGDPLVLSFRTKYIDVFPPVMTSIWPAANTTQAAPSGLINITFDEPLQQSAITVTNFVVQKVGGASQVRTLSYAEENGRGAVMIHLPNGVDPGAGYRFGYKGVVDLLGNSTSTTVFDIYDFSVRPGGYVFSVLDSLDAGSSGLVLPTAPSDRIGTDSVRVEGSTARLVGLVSPNYGSAMVHVVWDTTAGQWFLRVPSDTASSAARARFTSQGTILRAYVYGDGSHSQMRLVIADNVDLFPAGPPEHREVTPWLTIDWVGWRDVTWDLGTDTLGAGTGNGVLEGTLRFDAVEFRYVQGLSAPSATLFVDHLQLIDRTVTGVDDSPPGVPAAFALYQNSPNPFNPSTRFTYDLASGGTVRLVVYDLLGREVEQLVNDYQPAGRHAFTWTPGSSVSRASGVYVARLTAAGEQGNPLFAGSIKLLLVK